MPASHGDSQSSRAERARERLAATTARLVPVLVAAKMLGVSRATMWRMLYDRDLPSMMLRGRRMLDVQDIDSFIKRQKTENGVAGR